jgi:two-component system response regulator AtoC
MLPAVNSPVVLVVSDDVDALSYLEMALRCEGLSVEAIEDSQDALQYLRNAVPICAIFLDISSAKNDAMQILRAIRRIERNLPVVVLSSNVPSGVVVEAMRAGASDFITKPIDPGTLRRALSNIFTSAESESPARGTGWAPNEAYFGSSPKMRSIHKLLGPVAWSEVPVLIQGETGVGKEVLARQLHARSRRAHKPFLKLNCAALPSELANTELFGYERGAFIGAVQRTPGVFELADGGTLLLDEIGDMDFKLQARLLQVLQDREFQRLGGKETVRVDIRVIAATHRDLEMAISAGKFRQDLYYWLNVVTLAVPPLRELREDIFPLTEFLLKKHCREPLPEITPRLQKPLLEYDWPGNVRELENLVRKFAILRNADAIASDLTARAKRRTSPGTAAMGTAASVSEGIAADQPSPEIEPILEQVTRAKHQAEAEAIIAALNTTHWNRRKAAALLKIDYKVLLYKIKKHGIQTGPGRETALNNNSDANAGAVPLAAANSTWQAEAYPTLRRALLVNLVSPDLSSHPLSTRAGDIGGGADEQKNVPLRAIVQGN